MMERTDAIFEAICENDRTDTAWCVVQEDANFAVIPQAYLTDGSYSGSHEVVCTVNDWREEYGCPDDSQPQEQEAALRELIESLDN